MAAHEKKIADAFRDEDDRVEEAKRILDVAMKDLPV